MTQKLIAYKRMPIWTKDTMPEALQRKHNTKVGTWGKITVLKGQLRFIELTEEGEEIASHLFEAGAENPHGRASGLASCGSGDRRCGVVPRILL